MYRAVQSNTENIKPQFAKLPPILGASRRMVCKSKPFISQLMKALGLLTKPKAADQAQSCSSEIVSMYCIAAASWSTHIQSSQHFVALGRVLQPAVHVPAATTQCSHAKGATYII
jgi:hypothetical protein